MNAINKAKVVYLKRFILLNREIDRMVNELEFWRNKLGKVTAVYTSEPKGGGTIYTKAEEIVAKIVDLEAEVNKSIDELIELREGITQVIKEVEDDRERLLLQYRYIQGLPFEVIAASMGFSWRHVHRVHASALTNVKIKDVIVCHT